ncbi:BtrH N-terminal domain-containing protein [Mycobacterium sp. HUMS_12744610]|uniref:BtrH N-terminal domain-containing protein n=2 Tax=Mycobacteriaceae TaxID=1762 RepID=A0ABV4BWP1_9MYCO|nr:BtrH N-terminal domain-containing protein [Mycolicibacter icosiumassiliensis]
MGAGQIAYRHRMGGHCGSSALRDLTEWAELGWESEPPTEGLVFALGGVVGFSYIRCARLRPQIYLVGRGGGLEEDYLTRIGAGLRVASTDDADLGWAWVTGEIDAGRPVMVWADIAELPYLRVRLSMSRHDVVIVGYDDDHQLAYVVDNDRDTIQSVPYENLRRARCSTGFPMPTRHTTYLIDWPRHVPELAVISGPALAASAASMRGEAAGPPLLNFNDADLAGAGLPGVRVFADDVRCWLDYFDDDALAEALFGLGAFIEKAGTGGGLFRRLQAHGCQHIAELLDNDAVAIAAAAARGAADLWTAVAEKAMDNSLSVRDRCAAAAHLAAGLPEAERCLAEALDHAARSLTGHIAAEARTKGAQ